MEDTSPTAVNEPVAEDSIPSASPTNEPTTSSEVTTEPSSQPAETTTEPVASQPETTKPVATEPEHQPRPAQRRIQELLQDNRQLKARLSSQQVPIPEQSLSAPKLSDLVQGREYVDPTELDQLGQQLWQQGAQTSSGRASLEVQQLRKEMELKDAIAETDRTAAQLYQDYPEIAKDPRLESKIVSLYQKQAVRQDPQTRTVYYDPSVKLSDIAKAEVEFYREVAESGKAQASVNLSSLQDGAAITPTTPGPSPEKSFDDMSLADQEKYLRAQGRDI